MKENRIPLFKAILLVFLSVLTISGSVIGIWLYYTSLVEERKSDAKYSINALLQTTSGQDKIATLLLEEMIGLSVEKKPHLYTFSTAHAEYRLRAYSGFKKVRIHKVYPSALLVDYELRKPFFVLADYENVAIDEEGVIFTLRPYFSPKKLPMLYLGIELLDDLCIAANAHDPRIHLAFNVFEVVKNIPNIHVEMIDVHQAFHESIGRREIILIFKKNSSEERMLVRLNTKTYEKELKTLIPLIPFLKIQENKICVDMRAQQIMLITKGALHERIYRNTLDCKR